MELMMSILDKLKEKPKTLLTRVNYDIIIELIKAKLKATDHDSIIGIMWSLINPLVTLLIIYIIFKRNFGAGIQAYPFYLLVGLVSINFFIETTSTTIGILYTNRQFILNTIIPKEDIIISNICIYIYKFIIKLAFTIAVSVYYKIFTWNVLLYIWPLLTAYIFFTLGVSLFLALSYCFVRDVAHIWSLILRLLFFITPIFYTLDKLPPWAAKAIYIFNPLTSFVISFRQIFTENFNSSVYIYSLFWGSIFFVLGYLTFVIFEDIAIERA
jgi:ABC-2 type transport system permease protein